MSFKLDSVKFNLFISCLEKFSKSKNEISLVFAKEFMKIKCGRLEYFLILKKIKIRSKITKKVILRDMKFITQINLEKKNYAILQLRDRIPFEKCSEIRFILVIDDNLLKVNTGAIFIIPEKKSIFFKDKKYFEKHLDLFAIIHKNTINNLIDFFKDGNSTLMTLDKEGIRFKNLDKNQNSELVCFLNAFLLYDFFKFEKLIKDIPKEFYFLEKDFLMFLRQSKKIKACKIYIYLKVLDANPQLIFLSYTKFENHLIYKLNRFMQ
jgi:hypothetical protein